MFNLEQAIADWRQNMLACGIETPVPLEELEIHLREEIERQVEIGLNESQAFDEATKSMGEAPALKAEFKQVSENSRDKFFRIVGGLSLAAQGIVMFLQTIKTLPPIDFGFTYLGGRFSYTNLLIGPAYDLFIRLFVVVGTVGYIYFAWDFYRDYPNIFRKKNAKPA